VSQKKWLPAIILLVLAVSGATAQTIRSESESAIERGNRSFAKDDYESALREYRSVPSSGGKSYAQALYNIGVCYYELFRTAEAIGFYRQALEVRHGRYPKASYALGVALEDLGRPAEAKEAYRQSIITSHGELAVAHFRLGLLIGSDGAYEAAETSFRKAISHPGEHVASSHNNLGVMLARQGRLTEAGREFETALRQSRGSFDEAAHNLELCRTLLTTPAKVQIAALEISGMMEAAVK
jgi:tetratricopeptide (TPR) repeat protein